MENQYHLIKSRRFLPLFLTQFLGAFNDNVFKNALLIWITYTVAGRSGYNAQIVVTIAAGLFILPFFLFSATAGQLADKYEKSRLIQIIKLVEIILMILCSVGFKLGNVVILMTVLFLMGGQSAFFGPLKYSILPTHLRKEELIGGNAIIEAGTFLSILAGTIWGGLLICTDNGVDIISATVILVAVAGWLSSMYIPRAEPAERTLKISYNIFKETWSIIQYTRGKRDVFLSILGISWFWFVGATFLAQFPTYTKSVIGGNEQVVTLFLAAFSIGIGAGSMLCNKLLRGEINAKYVPAGALGMAVFTVDFFFASRNVGVVNARELIGVTLFLTSFNNLRIIIDLVLISLCAGIYIVPLYATLQSRSEASHLSRVIAGNNVINAIFMVFSAIGTVGMLSLGLSVTHVFLSLAFLNVTAYFVVRKLVLD